MTTTCRRHSSAPSTQSGPTAGYLLLRSGTAEHGEKDRLSQSILAPGAGAAITPDKMDYPRAKLEQILADLLPSKAHPLRPSFDDIKLAGDRLSQLLITARTDAGLARSLPQATYFNIIHDIAASRITWELVPFGGRCPALEPGLSRRLLDEQLSPARPQSPSDPDKLRILVITNPTGDLAGAAAEGRALAQAIARHDPTSRRIETVTLDFERATKKNILDHLRQDHFDVVHYAGHGYFDPADRSRCGLICHPPRGKETGASSTIDPARQVLNGTDLLKLSCIPPLIVFNACEVGRVRGPLPGDALPTRGKAKRPADDRLKVPAATRVEQAIGVAEACLRAGVAAFISTYWPVQDDGAARFADVFYGGLLAGKDVGASITAARKALHDARLRDWANYIHYGDRQLTLVRAQSTT